MYSMLGRKNLLNIIAISMTVKRIKNHQNFNVFTLRTKLQFHQKSKSECYKICLWYISTVKYSKLSDVQYFKCFRSSSLLTTCCLLSFCWTWLYVWQKRFCNKNIGCYQFVILSVNVFIKILILIFI